MKVSTSIGDTLAQGVILDLEDPEHAIFALPLVHRIDTQSVNTLEVDDKEGTTIVVLGATNATQLRSTPHAKICVIGNLPNTRGSWALPAL
jgi:hypothetical protein